MDSNGNNASVPRLVEGVGLTVVAAYHGQACHAALHRIILPDDVPFHSLTGEYRIARPAAR